MNCKCSSSDLFNFGCRCSYLGNRKPRILGPTSYMISVTFEQTTASVTKTPILDVFQQPLKLSIPETAIYQISFSGTFKGSGVITLEMNNKITAGSTVSFNTFWQGGPMELPIHAAFLENLSLGEITLSWQASNGIIAGKNISLFLQKI